MPSRRRIGKPREPGALAIEHASESWGEKKAEFAFAAQGDGIGRHEFFVAIPRMTHDEMAPAWRAEKTGELGGVILSGIERRKAGEALVGGEAARRRLPCKPASEPGNAKRLDHSGAAPQDCREAIGARPHPDLATKPSLFETRE